MKQRTNLTSLNVALSCSFNFNTFLVSCHAASRAPCSCHSVSSWDRSSNFGALGAALMRFTWANISERWILVSNVSVTNSLREIHTLDWFPHVCALPENRLRRLHILKNATQLSCIRWSAKRWSSSQLFITPLIRFPWPIVTLVGNGSSFMPITFLQHSYCTFVTILFRPFAKLFINLTMCEWALFPKPTATLGLVEQAFWRVPFFTKWVIASSFKVILAKQSKHSSLELLPLGLVVLDAFSFCCMKEFGDGVDGVTCPRLSISWRKLQLSPLEHCPLDSPCQQSPGVLCSRCFVPWFLTTTFLSEFPFLASKFLIREFCSILLFTIVFNLW